MRTRPVTRGAQGAKSPLENFSPPLKKCVGHNLKNLGPSQKSLRPSWCSKLVTGLMRTNLCEKESVLEMCCDRITVSILDVY